MEEQLDVGMKLARKKPVIVETWKFTEDNTDRILKWVSEGNGRARYVQPTVITVSEKDEQGNLKKEPMEVPPYLLIETLEGTMQANLGDIIIRGMAGEFYPCKPEVFAITYESLVS